MKLDTFPNLDRQLLAGDELTTNDLAYGDARLDELHAAFTKLVREHRIYGFNFVFVIDNREYAVDPRIVGSISTAKFVNDWRKLST